MSVGFVCSDSLDACVESEIVRWDPASSTVSRAEAVEATDNAQQSSKPDAEALEAVIRQR
ncbi:hypothetical protein [Embleya scabrispora]|uniref:hypothetical protein n=1 Tax=Embleya scabrispora TaxID=159449 RepID=UPI001374D7F4|nr:hypothetical protein [Embleya scabrispora]